MKKLELKKIDGQLLEAVLDGAQIVGYKSSINKHFVLVDRLHTEMYKNTSEVRRFALYISDNNEEFLLHIQYALTPAQARKEVNKEYNEQFQHEIRIGAYKSEKSN